MAAEKLGLFYFVLETDSTNTWTWKSLKHLQPTKCSLLEEVYLLSALMGWESMRVAVRFDLNTTLYPCCDVEEKVQTFSTNHWICMNEFSVSGCKTLFVFLMSLKCVFFLLFCLVWNLAAKGCPLPLSPPLSLGTLRTPVRLHVSDCQEKLCVQPSITRLFIDFSWLESIGGRTAQVS